MLDLELKHLEYEVGVARKQRDHWQNRAEKAERALQNTVDTLKIIAQKQEEFDPPGTARDGWEIASQFARGSLHSDDVKEALKGMKK